MRLCAYDTPLPRQHSATPSSTKFTDGVAAIQYMRILEVPRQTGNSSEALCHRKQTARAPHTGYLFQWVTTFWRSDNNMALKPTSANQQDQPKRQDLAFLRTYMSAATIPSKPFRP